MTVTDQLVKKGCKIEDSYKPSLHDEDDNNDDYEDDKCSQTSTNPSI